MIERAFIHVTGPAGGGKTTLIERLLASRHGEALAVARCTQVDELPEETEAAPAGDAELKRYRDAGAWAVARYQFPPSRRDTDTFWSTDLMEGFSTGVVLEGDLPFDFRPDLTVFVAVPLPEGRALLERHLFDRTEAHRQEIATLAELVEAPDAEQRVADYLAEKVGISLPMLPEEFVIRFWGSQHSLRAAAHGQLRELLQSLRAKGPPPPEERWVLAEPCAGILQAGLVVVNARDPGQRERGEALLEQLKHLRQDKEIFHQVAGRRANRLPVTARVADLGDEQDAALRQVLARVRRAVRRVRPED